MLIRELPKKQKTFKEVKIGEVFKCAGVRKENAPHMRVVEVSTAGGNTINAVHLASGTLVHVTPDIPVESVTGYFVEET